MLLLGPAVAPAIDFYCDGTPYGTVVGLVDGNVVVPPGGACLLDGATVNDNADEEWLFQKYVVPGAPQNDIFFMRERSRPNHVWLDGPVVAIGPRRGEDHQYMLRLVMGRTNDPHVKADAPRRERYVPVLGFINSPGNIPLNTYLTWTRGGNNVVFGGPLEKAVRVDIVPAGH